MNNHPSRGDRPDDDDPTEAAALAAVNRLRAAWNLEPIVERDPDEVRHELSGDRDAMAVAVAVLHRPGCGGTVPDALDAALAGKPPAAAFDLPPGVACAIAHRTPAAHAAAVVDALDAELERFAGRYAADPQHGREAAHLAVHRFHGATRAGLAASIAAEGSGAIDPTTGQPVSVLADQLAAAAEFAADVVVSDMVERLRDDLAVMTGLPADDELAEPGHEVCCRRAAVLHMLGQLRGDADMQDEAVRLALIVCHDRPDLRPSDVFRAGAPPLVLPADAMPPEIDAALCTELAAIAHVDGGAGP